MRRRTELLVSDYAGRGFTVELVRALRERGHDAVYSYCASVSTPKGSLADATGSIVGVRAGRTFDKYNLCRRLASEVRYGVNLTRLVWRRRPVEHVVVNMPLVCCWSRGR